VAGPRPPCLPLLPRPDPWACPHCQAALQRTRRIRDLDHPLRAASQAQVSLDSVPRGKDPTFEVADKAPFSRQRQLTPARSPQASPALSRKACQAALCSVVPRAHQKLKITLPGRSGQEEKRKPELDG
jgi:hypothetical protein